MYKVPRVIAALLAVLTLAGCNASTLSQGIGTQSGNTEISQGTSGSDPISSENVNSSETALAPQNSNSAAAQATSAQLQQNAALGSGNSMAFLPVEGAPQGKVSALSRSLGASAKVHGLSVVPANLPGSDYRIKGYFSALSDGSGTLLIYIWDVIDASGNRVHRINGQERSGSTHTDPWQAITDTEIARVADTTAARLKSWVDTRS